MRTADKINGLVQAGIDCELAEKVVSAGFSLTKVKSATKIELAKHFSKDEVEILSNLTRRAIAQDITDRLFAESASRCCLCWQWDDRSPLIIHHIVEHSKTQDDSYENLVLLCLNHHAEVHTVWHMARHPYPPHYIQTQKNKWINAVAEYQAGRRSKPGAGEVRQILKPVAPRLDIYFTGRKELLDQLAQNLASDNGTVHAIVGMGGIGKTSLAKKISHDVIDIYTGGVFWTSLADVDGYATNVLRTWLVICGNDLTDASLNTTDLTSYARSLIAKYIDENGRALFVIDDIQERWLGTAKTIIDAIPINCPLLITTRNQEIARMLNAKVYSLSELSSSESFELFSMFVGRKLTDQEPDAFRSLSKKLGHLPLAIELAGKRIAIEIEKPTFSMQSFLNSLRAYGANKLALKGQNGLVATFLITYDALSPEVQVVFRKFGVFATNLIVAEHLAAVSQISLNDIEILLDELVANSLLNWGTAEGLYAIHPLVKQFAAHLLSLSISELESTQIRYVAYFASYVAASIEDSGKPHQKLDSAWPDIRNAFELAVYHKYDKIINQLANALWRDSEFLYVRGYVQDAVYILNTAFDVCKRNQWKINECEHLNHLGTAYNHLGQTERALDSYQLALTLSHELKLSNIEGACLHNLGIIYDLIGQLQLALSYYLQAMEIGKINQNSYLVGDVLSSIAGVHRTLGQLDDAKQSYNASLELSRLHKDRKSEGNSLSNLGLIYYDEKDYDTATKYIEQGLEIAREIGDKRGEANRLGHLGNICNLMSKPEQAIRYYSDAVKICRAISHRINEGNWLGNMGNSYRYLGKYADSIRLYKQALTISEEVKSQKQKIIWCINLGLTYTSIQQWDQAIIFLERAADISEELRDYENFQTAINKLTGVYLQLGETKKVVNCHKRQLKVSQDVGDLESACNLFNLIGLSLLHLGFMEEAVIYLEQGLATSRKLQNKILEGDCLTNLGLHARNIDEYTKAVSLYDNAIACYRVADSKIGEAIVVSELSIIQLQKGQIDLAIDNLNVALGIFQGFKYVPKYGFTLGNLGNAYQTKGDIEKAIEYHNQALAISQTIHDHLNIANWTGALAQDYVYLEDFEKARDNYENCLEMSQKMGLASLEARCLQGLGIICRNESHLNLSNKYFQEVLAISRRLGDIGLQGTCLFSLGQNCIEQHNIKDAKKYFEQALQIAQQVDNPILEANVLWQLGVIHEPTNLDKAFSYMIDSVTVLERIGVEVEQEKANKLNKVRAKLDSVEC